MPSVNNKAYDALLKLLGLLIHGIKKHSSNTRITATLSVIELEAVKAELELLRTTYLQQERDAREAYEQFNAKFKSAQKRISNDSRIIKGILDPRAEVLLDFGITPEKAKTQARLHLKGVS